MSDKLDSIRNGRARAAIIELVRGRHRAQKSRMDHVELWHMLRGLALDVGENDIITFLQDLEVMGYIQYVQEQDRQTNRVTIAQIQLCAKGLRLAEGSIKDDSVLF